MPKRWSRPQVNLLQIAIGAYVILCQRVLRIQKHNLAQLVVILQRLGAHALRSELELRKQRVHKLGDWSRLELVLDFTAHGQRLSIANRLRNHHIDDSFLKEVYQLHHLLLLPLLTFSITHWLHDRIHLLLKGVLVAATLTLSLVSQSGLLFFLIGSELALLLFYWTALFGPGLHLLSLAKVLHLVAHAVEFILLLAVSILASQVAPPVLLQDNHRVNNLFLLLLSLCWCYHCDKGLVKDDFSVVTLNDH